MYLILSLIDLFFVDRYRRNRKIKSERKSLDRVIFRSEDDFDFVIAYDASLMVRENRLEDARNRFQEALEKASDFSSSNQKYVKNYCEFFLSLFEEKNSESRIYLKNAIKINADPLTKIFLRLPKEGAIDKILSS